MQLNRDWIVTWIKDMPDGDFEKNTWGGGSNTQVSKINTEHPGIAIYGWEWESRQGEGD